MTREQRITNGTTGILLCISAFAVFALVPAGNVWPWVLMFLSVGIGLTAGAIAAKDAADKRASAALPSE